MGRAVTGFWWSPTAEGTPALVVTAAFFTLGGAAGSFFAFRMSDPGLDTMAAYLERFLMAAQAAELYVPAFPELLWRELRWPLAAVLLGVSALGLFGIPVLSAMRGFLLSFSIASFALSYGYDGLATAFFLLGVPGIFSVPAFLLLMTQSFSTACTLAGRSGHREFPFHREHLFRCGVCAAAVCISLLLERYLVPALIAGAAGALLG